jgi:hypothetical protein
MQCTFPDVVVAAVMADGASAFLAELLVCTTSTGRTSMTYLHTNLSGRTAERCVFGKGRLQSITKGSDDTNAMGLDEGRMRYMGRQAGGVLYILWGLHHTSENV